MRSLQTVEDFEAALIAEFRSDGHDVFERDGTWFARVVTIDPTGTIEPVAVNITKYAIGMERRLS